MTLSLAPADPPSGLMGVSELQAASAAATMATPAAPANRNDRAEGPGKNCA
ncbi:MAG TPA: hypothetical protein VHE78_12075 [Gemmatimonadaceae bacterium]|nr:hypothetical protein [Gemmatimonadaceae bacterium]